MILLSRLIAWFNIIAVLDISQGYVLFSANIDDFKNIADKVLPSDFAKKLVQLAESPVIPRNHKDQDDKSEEIKLQNSKSPKHKASKREKENINKNPKDNVNNEDYISDAFRDNARHVIKKLAQEIKEEVMKELMDNILQMKLKDRLEEKINDMTSTELDHKQNKQLNSAIKSSADKFINHKNSNKIRFQEVKGKYQFHKDMKTLNDPDLEIDNKYPTIENTDLTAKHDSYEDYVAPEKEKNIFVSAENSKIRTTKRHIARHEVNTAQNTFVNEGLKNSRPKSKLNQKIKAISEYKDEEKVTKETKAVTGDLWFDENEDETKIMSDGIEHGIKPSSKYRSMKPTRQRYSMSSPNYYISLPTIAERYDFNEPIPERDRYREIIRPLTTPLSTINKKIPSMYL